MDNMRHLPTVTFVILGGLWMGGLIPDHLATGLFVAYAVVDVVTGGKLFRPDQQREPFQVILLQLIGLAIMGAMFLDWIPFMVFFPFFVGVIVLAGALSPNGFSR